MTLPFFKSAVLLATSCLIIQVSWAQTQSEETSPNNSEEPIDEIIVEGIRGWEGHEGMDAFWSGDYIKAELEFEREFLSLKRANSNRENAAFAADIGFDRAAATGDAAVGGGSFGGPGGGPTAGFGNDTTPSVGQNGSFKNRKVKGQNLLNDGKLTEQDFAFTKYMSALSELQLGKNKEAKSSLKTSLHYDDTNYDARMRLGLIYVLEDDFNKAADQLESLEKMRRKCKERACPEYDEILSSAGTLAAGLTKALNQ